MGVVGGGVLFTIAASFIQLGVEGCSETACVMFLLTIIPDFFIWCRVDQGLDMCV